MKNITMAVVLIIAITACKTEKKKEEIINQEKMETMELSNKEKGVALLRSLETGDQTPVGYINAEKYIQHNLGVADGLEGSVPYCKTLRKAVLKQMWLELMRMVIMYLPIPFMIFSGQNRLRCFSLRRREDCGTLGYLIDIAPVNPSGHSQMTALLNLQISVKL